MNEFFAYSGGETLMVILFIGLPALALYHARTFVKKL
ncbi:hypothetical protein BKA01_001648 [Pseudonocardia eucalypti]|nr:hypothetical protein [Pseudonocardia eucalypti]